jgi:glyoxylase-like metal-dependent hydrolase (beta-lactamase superfamily II)
MSILTADRSSPRTSTLAIQPLLLGEVEVDHSFLGWAIFDRADIAALVGSLWDRVELLDGDQELFAGVRTLHTGGHTPGHQMIYVDTPEGRAIITGDAAYIADLNVGAQVPSGYWVDLPDTMAALRRIAADSEGIVLPMHDRSIHERYPQGIGGA